MDKNLDVIKTISDSKLRDSLVNLIKNNASNDVSVAPNIPEKKIRNSIKKMEIPSGSNILVLFDTSISMSGKSGICVTDDGIYWKENKIGSIKFDHMKPLNIEIDICKTIKINGKELSLVQLLINKKNWHFADFLSCLLGLEQTPAGPMYKDENAKFDLLTKALHDHKTGGKVCIKIVETLGQIGDERSTEELIKSLKDPDTYLRGLYSKENVCIKISETLGKIGGDRAAETLIELLDDMKTNGELCLAIARALGQIGDEKSKKALKRASRDPIRGKTNFYGRLEPPLSMVASYVLKEIQGENDEENEVEEHIEDLKDNDIGIRKQAVKGLGKTKDEKGVEPLIQALKDEDAGVRKQAAGALGKIKDERGVEPLIQALKDEAEYVREKAAESLGKIGDRRSIKPLIQVAQEDKSTLVRQDSVLAIAEIGDIVAIEPMRQLCNDKKWPVRSLAKQALKKLESRKKEEDKC